MKKISIAIDGPAAAGKSTVAKIIADKLGYVYVDTGAMYRALTLKALEKKADLHNENELIVILQDTEITLLPGEKGQRVLTDGKDVTGEIRNADVTNHVSIASKHKQVREEMVKRQQILGASGGVVMDGRDIGTHVLPNAEVKIFLLASVDERAQRRQLENIEKGYPSDLEKIKQEIAARDKLDSEREVAPLRKAEDAVVIDTTSKSIEQVVDEILALVSERIG